jgi:hypothetical protein
MPQFRKKPIVIDAYQWNPKDVPSSLPDWLWATIGQRPQLFNERTGALIIRTLEGDMVAEPGDWIIRGVKHELYPCKPDIFAATYEPVSG